MLDTGSVGYDRLHPSLWIWNYVCARSVICGIAGFAIGMSRRTSCWLSTACDAGSSDLICHRGGSLWTWLSRQEEPVPNGGLGNGMNVGHWSMKGSNCVILKGIQSFDRRTEKILVPPRGVVPQTLQLRVSEVYVRPIHHHHKGRTPYFQSSFITSATSYDLSLPRPADSTNRGDSEISQKSTRSG